MTARVMVLTLGGTIASLPSTSGAGGGAIPTLTGDDLLAMAPGLAQVAEVTAHTIMQVPSCDIRPQDVRAVAETIAVATGARALPEDPAEALPAVVEITAAAADAVTLAVLDALTSASPLAPAWEQPPTLVDIAPDFTAAFADLP